MKKTESAKRLPKLLRVLAFPACLLGTRVLGVEIPPSTEQLVVVVSEGWEKVPAKASLWEKKSGRWKPYQTALPAVVGSSGMAWGRGVFSPDVLGYAASEPRKREGDKRAPAGVFQLVSAFGREEESSSVPRMPFLRVKEDTEAVEDPKSTHYNRIVQRSELSEHDWGSSEKMFQIGELYRSGIIVGHNWNKPIPGEGSCIFLHRWRTNRKGTLGCTAFSPADLRTVLGWLDVRRKPLLIQMPECALQRLEWNFIGGYATSGGTPLKAD
jgi:D-alanyl-D-alanine dipeptidase